MVKEKWISTHIKDIATIYGRIGFRGYTKQDIVKPGFGAISLSPSNIKDGKVTYAPATYISWEKYEESPEIKLSDGDVVLVKTGSTFGKTAYIDRLPWPTTLNPQIVVFKKLKIHAKLFAYFMASKNIQEQISSVIVGGAIPTLSQEQVYAFDIVYPPDAKEQAAIAEALSDVDNLISSLQKLIKKKKAIKQGAMQELLTGKKRLPGFYREWRIVQIGETLSIGHGQSQKTVENRFGKYPILATGGCIGYANDFLWDKPSVLIGRKGTIDKPQYADYPFWTIDTLFYTKIFDGYDAKFIYYKFCMIDWQQYNEASGVPSLNATTIENLQIIVPEKDEQQAIAQLLSDIDSEIEQLEKKLVKYQQIKQGMMQELLTGRIRLKEGEKNA